VNVPVRQRPCPLAPTTAGLWADCAGSGYDNAFTSDGGRRARALLQARTTVTAGDRPSDVAAASSVLEAAYGGAKRCAKRWR